MKTIRTRAIVLRRTNYGEADRILQLLTPEGKRGVIVRGVRREKSRLAGGIELFAICDVVIGDGKGGLGVLTSASLIFFYRHIMEDYDRMQFAYIAIKLVSKSSEMVNEPEWYDLLAEILASLDKLLIQLEVIQMWFYLRYSALMGYELSLWHDTIGKKLFADKNYQYDVVDKGLRLSDNGELSADHIKLLRLVSTRPIITIAQIGGIDNIMGVCLLVAREHAAV